MNKQATSTIADGIVENRADGQTVIRFERRLSHPIDRVWAALTEPEQLLGWWGDASLELVEGGAFNLRWLNDDDEHGTAVMTARITHIDPPHLLETEGSWGADHGEGKDSIDAGLRWELESDGEATVLRFSNTVPTRDLPAEASLNNVAGWHFHLDALASVLDGQTVDLVAVEGWEPIHEAYVAREG
jgi:uncharacterized protein YndB with AHSA1/START domain